MCAFLGVAWLICQNLDYKQPLPEDIRSNLLSNWTFIWVIAAIYTPWRMYQASRLVPVMVKRGYALRNPDLDGVRPIAWRYLAGVLVGMAAVGWLGPNLLALIFGRSDLHDWVSRHPVSTLFAMYAGGAVAYLVSRTLIGMVVSASVANLELIPIPFHVDSCNGFWPFGYFGLRNVIGVWFLFLTIPQLLLAAFASEMSSETIELAGFIVLYGVGFVWMMASDLAMSIWDIHVIMSHYRQSILKATTEKYATLLASIDRTTIPPDSDYLRLLALDLKYKTEMREYMQWPFGYLRFLAAAGVGAVAGPLIGFIVQRLTK